tara:strand:+ start:1460 stop:2203 length:744 start_codon:yes stop_codon:yes gene_type:complete
MKNIFVLLTLSIVLFSCKKPPKAGQVSLKIEHLVGTESFDFDTMKYVSPTNHPYKITKLVYYISEITYIMTDGTEEVQAAGFLINPDEESTLKITNSDLRPGTYNKVRFQFGIDSTNNVTDYLAQSLENISMEWPDQLGPGDYHYMKFEGKYDSLSTGIEKSFIYHYGPTIGNDNSFSVELAVAEFVIDDNSFNVIVNADIQEWFQNPTLYNFPDYSMVMMNQSFQEIYKANGQSVFSFKQLTEDAQ